VNFRLHQRTEVVFGDGLTGIIGPNGAGKTTLLEAIAFAIYGMRAARGGRDSIRWRRAKPRAEVRVELDFALAGHEYRVARTLFNAELYLDGGTQPIVVGTTDVSDRLARALRMSHDEFFKTYFTGQKELAMMAELGPADRRRFLNRLLDYDRLLMAQKKLRERRNVMAAELTALQALVPDPAALAAERAGRAAEDAAARQMLADAEEKFASAKSASDQHLPVFAGLREFQDRFRRLTTQRALEAERVAHVMEVVGKLEKELTEATEQAGRREAQLKDLDKRLKQTTKAAGQVRGILEHLESSREAYAAEQALYEEKRGAWERDRADAEAVRRNLRDTFKDIKEQKDRIESLGTSGACPTCGRTLGSEYGAVLGLIDGQLQEVTANGQFYAARVEQLADLPEELVQRDKLRHEAAHQVEALAQDLALARRAADDALAIEKERQRIVAEAARLPRIRKELAAAMERRAGLVDALAAVEKDLAALEFDESRFLKAEREMERLEKAWRDAERVVSAAQAEVRLAHERLAEAQRREDEARERIGRRVELQAQVRLHAELDRALDDLSAELNSQIGPELSALAGEFMGSLTDGQYDEVQLDESFDATVYEAGEARPVLSGGEEDLLNLVLRLGVSQMIADRSGQPLSLLVLDEIFGSLDDLKQASVLHLLRALASRFPQVILISHVEGVRESLDHVLRVRYDEASGCSQVTVEQGPDRVPGGGADDAHVAA
jgi:exonuclease SbcC